jgi:hypothetical protein
MAMTNGQLPQHVQVTDDGFTLAAAATRVRPCEFKHPAPHYLPMDVVGQALAAAAAEDGSLLNFDLPGFYTEHVRAAMGPGVDPPLTYDAFTAAVLTEILLELQAYGYLAHRGNGDSYDYWLAKPFGSG